MKTLKVQTIILSPCCLSSTSEPLREDSISPLGHSQFTLVSLSWLFCRQKETVSISSQVLFYFIMIDSWHLRSELCKFINAFCISWMNRATFSLLKWLFFSPPGCSVREADHILLLYMFQIWSQRGPEDGGVYTLSLFTSSCRPPSTPSSFIKVTAFYF